MALNTNLILLKLTYHN